MYQFLNSIRQWFTGQQEVLPAKSSVQGKDQNEMDAMKELLEFTAGGQTDLDSLLAGCKISGLSIADAIQRHNHANRVKLGLTGRPLNMPMKTAV